MAQCTLIRQNRVLVIIAAALLYALWLLFATSKPTSVQSKKTRRSTAQVDALTNRSAKIYEFVPSRSTSTATTFTVAPPEDRTVNKTGRYVNLCHTVAFSAAVRTGNRLFVLAAMLHAAHLNGRRVAMLRRNRWLDRWFHLRVTRVDSVLCPCHEVNQKDYFHHYSPISYNRTHIAGKSLLLCGLFQSWKYTVGVESALRHHLRLLPDVSAAIHKYLDQIRPPSWNNFTRIGIHVRAGDIMTKDAWQVGNNIPQRPYFEQAMKRFVSQGLRIQFIVCSDSIDWVKTAINLSSIVYELNQTSWTKNKVLIDLVHSEGHNAGFDLGLLSLCDGVIITTGTYGWWGGWLANKTTIYYSGWPRPGSYWGKRFRRDDYYPPNWIPIGGPEFSWRNYTVS